MSKQGATRTQPDDQASRQQKNMEQIIRRVIRTRRQEEGFGHSIPPDSWEAPNVRKAVMGAAKYFAGQCCEAEVEALVDDPHPDDTEMETALQEVQRALNGLMVFTAPDSEPHCKSSASPGTAPVGCSTERQEAYAATATNYFHWLLAGDKWVLDVRDGLPAGLSERQMLDLLLCPVRRVLSFDDYAGHGLNPWLTTGRILSEREVSAPRQEYPRPREIAVNAYVPDGNEEDCDDGKDCDDAEDDGEEAQAVDTREITVELTRPDGTYLLHTVQRQGPSDFTSYTAQALTWWWENISRIADEAAMKLIWEWFRGTEPADKKHYPRFPHVFFSCERKSVSGEVDALCRTMCENDFYLDSSAALRYLMMGTEAPLLGFRCSRDLPFHSDKQEFLTGRYYMTVPAWSLPEEVAEYWRQVRPQTARERRLPTEEHLTLFAFVLRHTPSGTEPRWAKLARLWRQEQGQTITRDRLYRTFSRVQKALFPPYEYPAQVKHLSPGMIGPDGRTPFDFRELAAWGEAVRLRRNNKNLPEGAEH